MNRTKYLLSFIPAAILAMTVPILTHPLLMLSWDIRLLIYLAGAIFLLSLPIALTYFRGRFIDVKWLVLIPVISSIFSCLPFILKLWDPSLIPRISGLAVNVPIVLYISCAFIGGRSDTSKP
jgi:hypothetical protein